MPSPPGTASSTAAASSTSRTSSTRRSSSTRAPRSSSPSPLSSSVSTGAAAPAAAPAPAPQPAVSRRISATPLRAPRPLEALSDALAHLGSSASALLAHHASAARSHVSAAAGAATASSPAPQPAEPAPAELQLPDAAQRVAWATWERVSDAHVFLLLGYAAGGLQMYALRDDVLEERLDIRGVLLPSEDAAGAVLAARLSHTGGQLVLACAAEQGITLAAYDLATHAVPRATLVRSASPPTTASEVQLRVSSSYVVLAHAGKLHVHCASTLAALRIIDVSSGSSTLPAFDLSSRILAYATPTPPRSGTGVIASPPGHSRLRSATSPRSASSSSSHAAAALDAGVQLSTHAYKLGGDVLGAAKTWGNAYWTSAATAAATGGVAGGEASSPARAGSPFSRSAPQASPRGGSPSSPALLPRSEAPRSSIAVLDLKRNRTLAHLTPAHRGADVRLVSLSPNAEMLLTADERGHGALVFELRPGVLGREGASWLRYRLFRGHTTASLIDAAWSRSGLLTLLSARGTAHVFALRNPLVAPSNPEPPTELSVTLNAIARTRRVADQNAPAVPAAEGAQEEAVDVPLPALAMLETPIRNAENAASTDEAAGASAKTASLQLMIFEGLTAAIALHHVTLAQEALPSAPTISPSSSSSGLTQMMRRASGMSLAMSPGAPPRRPSSATPATPAARLVASCTRAACWNEVARADDGLEVRLPFALSATRKTMDAAPPASWISRAEITTHGGAPGPLYLSRQMVFNTYDLPTLARRRKVPLYVELHRAAASRLVVRDEVEARSNSEPQDGGTPTSFDERLASAMRLSAFDSDAARSASRSPSAHIPAFPQGGRARQPSWTSRASAGIAAIPIRAGALGMSARRGWSSGTPEKKKVAPLLSFEEASDDAALFVSATTPASLGTNEGSLRRVGLLESASNGSSAETPPTGNESEDEWDGLRDREFQPRSVPKMDEEEVEVKRREASEDVVGIFGGFEEDAIASRATTTREVDGGVEATEPLKAAQPTQLFYSRHLAASLTAPGSMPSSLSRAIPGGLEKDEAASTKNAARPSSSAPSSDPIIVDSARSTRVVKSATQKTGKGKKGHRD